MPRFLDNIGRFFNCFKKSDNERDEFHRIASKIDDEFTDVFHDRIDGYTAKAGQLIDKWLDGEDKHECTSLLMDFKDGINDCFDETKGLVHDVLGYEPPSNFERFCGRVEQLFNDLFGDD